MYKTTTLFTTKPRPQTPRLRLPAEKCIVCTRARSLTSGWSHDGHARAARTPNLYFISCVDCALVISRERDARCARRESVNPRYFDYNVCLYSMYMRAPRASHQINFGRADVSPCFVERWSHFVKPQKDTKKTHVDGACGHL